MYPIAFRFVFEGVSGGRSHGQSLAHHHHRIRHRLPPTLAWCAWVVALASGAMDSAYGQIEPAWSRFVEGNGQTVALALAPSGHLSVVAGAAGNVVTATYDAQGNRLWSATFDGGAYEDPTGLVVDAAGQAWVVGRAIPPNGVGATSLFALKYDTQGRLAWERRLMGTNLWSGHVALLDGGNVCVVGVGGKEGGEFVEYDPNGAVLWRRQYPVGADAYLDWGTVRASATGEIYLAAVEHAANVPARLILQKRGRSGDELWTAKSFETQLAVGGDFVLDGDGNAYFSAATDLRTFVLAKYGPDGKLVWTRSRNRPYATVQQSVILDAGGGLTVAGYDSEYRKLCSDCGDSETIYRLTVARYSSGGDVLWDADARLGRELPNFGRGLLQTDPDGSVYVGANYSSRSDDTGTRTEFVLRKFGPGGGQVWSTNMAGILLGNLQTDTAGSLYLSVGNNSSNVIRKYVQSRRAPSLVTDLVSQTVLKGHEALLFVQARGFPSPAFRWEFEGAELPGATNNSLRFVSAESNRAGRYRVAISNELGVVWSSPATLVVQGQAPNVSIQVAAGRSAVQSGESVQLCATVTGGPLPEVQWLHEGTALAGQTNLCLSLTDLQPGQAGAYRVVATNEFGSAAREVNVTVAPAVITISGANPPLIVGQCAMLCASNGLLPPVTYQWQRNGVNLAGEDGPCLTVCATSTNDAGAYGVIVGNPAGSYVLPAFSLPVIDAAPKSAIVALSAGSLESYVGETLALRAEYQGSPATIRWLFNGLDLPGATNRVLGLPEVRTNQAGAYSFVASNAFGAVTSSVAQVQVSYAAPVVVFNPVDRTVFEGTRVAFPVFARGGPPPTYLLQFNGRLLDADFSYDCCDSGFGGFVLEDVTLADSGEYAFVATNTLGAVTSVVARLTVVPPGPWDHWVQRNPLPQSNPLLALTHGPAGFVAVGDEGATVTSPDGIQWSDQGRRGQKALNGVAFGQGLHVAVGNGGVIYSSATGTNWVRRYSAYQTRLDDVVHGNQRFVAVGAIAGGNGVVFESVDATHWVRHLPPGVPELTSVTYGNGRFVAVGLGIILSSEDAIEWVPRLVLSPVTELTAARFVGERFVVVGDAGGIWVSADGRDWESRDGGTNRKLLGITHGNGRYVAVGTRGAILSSSDTLAWRPEESGTPDRLEAVDFANGLFVATGENGTIVTAPDGAIWTKRNQGTTRDLDGLAASADAVLVVVGKGGTLLVSHDGARYEERDSGTSSDLHGVAWGDGEWMAVGDEGAIVGSRDTLRWTARASGVTTALKDVIRADGQWIVVGTRATVLTSPDGLIWTRHLTEGNTPAALDLNGVAFGNGTYLVVGDGIGGANGSLFRSTDAARWSLLPYSFGKNLRGITFDQGMFAIVGNDGLVATTVDGVAYDGGWGRGGGNLRDVAWTYDRWTVAGNDGFVGTLQGAPGALVRRTTRLGVHLHRAVAHRGKVVVIGNHGTILQSDTVAGILETPVRRPDGAVTVGMSGVRDRVYRLQATTTPGDWTTLTVFTNRTERVDYVDEDAARTPYRFYQLREE